MVISVEKLTAVATYLNYMAYFWGKSLSQSSQVVLSLEKRDTVATGLSTPEDMSLICYAPLATRIPYGTVLVEISHGILSFWAPFSITASLKR